MQLYVVLPRSTHVAPLRHGLGSHGSRVPSTCITIQHAFYSIQQELKAISSQKKLRYNSSLSLIYMYVYMLQCPYLHVHVYLNPNFHFNLVLPLFSLEDPQQGSPHHLPNINLCNN